MKTKNSCYTYFAITGRFDPLAITDLLQLSPEHTRRIGTKRKNGSICDAARWEIGRCDRYDPIVANQMEKTISMLLDKIDILNKIREDYGASLYLSVVPHVYAEEAAPCLAPSLAVIDFCHATRTEIDIDLYTYAKTDD